VFFVRVRLPDRAVTRRGGTSGEWQDSDFHFLALAFRHERGATHAPLRVNDCQFALGLESNRSAPMHRDGLSSGAGSCRAAVALTFRSARREPTKMPTSRPCRDRFRSALPQPRPCRGGRTTHLKNGGPRYACSTTPWPCTIWCRAGPLLNQEGNEQAQEARATIAFRHT
jgi:hypothetical protein